MSDYRLDPSSQTHAYAGYGMTKSRPMTPVDNYTKSNNPRLGMDARANSIGMNNMSSNRIVSQRSSSHPEHHIGIPHENKSYPSEYSVMMSKSSGRVSVPMSVNPGSGKAGSPIPPAHGNPAYYQPMLQARAPGMEMSGNGEWNGQPPQQYTSPNDPNPQRYQRNNTSLGERFPPQTPSTVTFLSEEELGQSWDNKEEVRRFPQVVVDNMLDNSWNNYCLPNIFLISRPALTVKQIKQFSTKLLLYIFYTQARDCIQLVAAQELYSRDLIYHKTKRVWYKRDKSASNYAITVVKEEFVLSRWSFIPCLENCKLKSNEFLSLAEINDCMKQLSQ